MPRVKELPMFFETYGQYTYVLRNIWIVYLVTEDLYDLWTVTEDLYDLWTVTEDLYDLWTVTEDLYDLWTVTEDLYDLWTVTEDLYDLWTVTEDLYDLWTVTEDLYDLWTVTEDLYDLWTVTEDLYDLWTVTEDLYDLWTVTEDLYDLWTVTEDLYDLWTVTEDLYDLWTVTEDLYDLWTVTEDLYDLWTVTEDLYDLWIGLSENSWSCGDNIRVHNLIILVLKSMRIKNRNLQINLSLLSDQIRSKVIVDLYPGQIRVVGVTFNGIRATMSGQDSSRGEARDDRLAESSNSPALARQGEGQAPSGVPVQDQNVFFRTLGTILTRFQTLASSTQRINIAKELKGLGAPEFKGEAEEGPVVADLWLNDVKIMLEGLHCSDMEKLDGMVSLLRGQARIWWTNVIHRMPNDQKTWYLFLEEFKHKYIGDQFIREMKQEFLNLKQLNRTVYEYECEFNKLSRFAAELIRTEKEACEWFVEGLRPRLKEMLIVLNLSSFQEVVNRAKALERAQNERFGDQKAQSSKRTGASSSSVPPKRGRDSGFQYQVRSESVVSSARGSNQMRARQTQLGKSGDGRAQQRHCQICERYHGGACRVESGACFRCGEIGHFLRDCPLGTGKPVQSERSASISQRGRGRGRGRSQTEFSTQQEMRSTARVYNLNISEDNEDPEIIAVGMPRVKGLPMFFETYGQYTYVLRNIWIVYLVTEDLYDLWTVTEDLYDLWTVTEDLYDLWTVTEDLYDLWTVTEDLYDLWTVTEDLYDLWTVTEDLYDLWTVTEDLYDLWTVTEDLYDLWTVTEDLYDLWTVTEDLYDLWTVTEDLYDLWTVTEDLYDLWTVTEDLYDLWTVTEDLYDLWIGPSENSWSCGDSIRVHNLIILVYLGFSIVYMGLSFEEQENQE
ncbi:hypothetical protein F3Y22_tig00112429pilonHSYRG00052 [Hibiscus syriacus]|uniref:CCHC-type domain-containing protein n=1 Tax=Hibiscus syriacus TaxID=106335 RepID=A0A6A2XJE0_HIBSY|nr:hypothetical protein F3Y22_tig00112429pilonHSYRG00052 [Hibiscus syriacus]